MLSASHLLNDGEAGGGGGVIVGLLEDQVLGGLNPPTHPNCNKSLKHSNSRFAHYYCFSFV